MFSSIIPDFLPAYLPMYPHSKTSPFPTFSISYSFSAARLPQTVGELILTQVPDPSLLDTYVHHHLPAATSTIKIVRHAPLRVSQDYRFFFFFFEESPPATAAEVLSGVAPGAACLGAGGRAACAASSARSTKICRARSAVTSGLQLRRRKRLLSSVALQYLSVFHGADVLQTYSITVELPTV